MDKQKEIEEMARDMDYGCTKRDLYPDDAKEIAKALYLLGYRKIDKDSVVLTREEYERLKSIEIAFEEFAKPDGILIPIEEYQKDFSSQFNKGYEKGCKENAGKIWDNGVGYGKEQARKEKAEKIFKRVFEEFNIFNDKEEILIYQVRDILRYIAKQFDVEIKE